MKVIRDGQTVEVELVGGSEVDAFGDIVSTPVVEEVAGVLVAPGATADMADAHDQDGVTVAYTCYFPKTFTKSLRGGRVRVGGQWFHVVGDPRPWPGDGIFGPRNLVVELAQSLG